MTSETFETVYGALVEYLELVDRARLAETCHRCRLSNLVIFRSGTTIDFAPRPGQYGCHVSDSFLRAVLSTANCSSLTLLNLYWCDKLTDEAIKAIAANCPSLTKLSCGRCKNLTDESIKAIAAKCPSLADLNVCDCSNLTDDAIMAIAAKCPTLKGLTVSSCKNLTGASIKAIAANWP